MNEAMEQYRKEVAALNARWTDTAPAVPRVRHVSLDDDVGTAIERVEATAREDRGGRAVVLPLEDWTRVWAVAAPLMEPPAP